MSGRKFLLRLASNFARIRHPSDLQQGLCTSSHFLLSQSSFHSSSCSQGPSVQLWPVQQAPKQHQDALYSTPRSPRRSQHDAAGEPSKRHALKCNTTAVSQAVACMVDRDVMPRDQLCRKMQQLSEQLVAEVGSYSSTELSAFAEACRKMDFRHAAAAAAIMNHLAPSAADIPADELSSLLWLASTLADEQAAQQHTSSSSGVTGGKEVLKNDGVVGAVSSSRIAHLPDVVLFMLGASQVLAGDLDALDCQELPVVARALTELEYRDPFLLTVLGECVLERKAELSEGELVALVGSFAAMGRWFFDNRLIDQLTVLLVERSCRGAAQQSSVQVVADCLAGINHKNKVLQQYLDEQGQRN